MNTRETLNNFSSKFSDTFKDNLYYKRAKYIFSRETLEITEYRKLHHNLCKLMFDDVKSGNEVWIQVNEIYPTNDNQNTEHSSNFLRVSLLTQYMLDYDKNMFQLLSAENEDHVIARETFRPYFLHFLIDISKIDKKERIFISKSEHLGQWFKGAFLPNEAIIHDKIDGYLMKGFLESSASPIHYEKGCLIINDTSLGSADLDNINSIYEAYKITTQDDTTVNNELNDIFRDTIFSEARVYNVGNANCIYIKGSCGNQPKNLLYDIGYNIPPYGCKLYKTPYIKARRAILQISNHIDCIVLSHWDLDHILGCAYAPKHLFLHKWIAPNFLTKEEYSVSARRLAVYLNVIGSLMLVERKPTSLRTDAFARITTGTSSISFWMGINPSPRKVSVRNDEHWITPVNREGIIIEVINYQGGNYINSLLLGDVPYSSIPNGVNLIKGTSIDYLVVPHHGGYMDYHELDSSTISSNAHAIISASGIGSHPHTTHTKALDKKFFQTSVTRDVDLYIEFSLLTPNSISKL